MSVEQIEQRLRAAVEAGDVHGVVATAADRSGTVYEGAAGVRILGGDDPMTPDTMFRIASMTKMVTTTAALQLVDRGELELDAPVASILPAFADLPVLEGFDGDTPVLRPQATTATVRHLMSHTSGLSYWFWNADIGRWQEATGTPDVLSGTEPSLHAALVADPGTRFEYGINTDWLGKVVEAVSGESLPGFWRTGLFEPLGMHDTTEHMSSEQRARSTAVHVRGEDAGQTATDLDWNQEPEFWAGGHCLYSTPRDYLRFQRMLLGGGELDGTRVLEEATVEAAFTNQIGDLDFPPVIRTARPDLSADFAVGPGYKFGLGLLLNTESIAGRRAAGSGAWAGIFNTHFWVDRATGITGAIYTQSLPFVEPRAFELYVDYEQALYASL